MINPQLRNRSVLCVHWLALSDVSQQGTAVLRRRRCPYPEESGIALRTWGQDTPGEFRLVVVAAPEEVWNSVRVETVAG